MRSGTSLRDDKNKPYVGTNLVFHHYITNIFSQTTKFLRILNIREKPCNLPLVHQWLQLTENFFQFPSKTCA